MKKTNKREQSTPSEKPQALTVETLREVRGGTASAARNNSEDKIAP